MYCKRLSCFLLSFIAFLGCFSIPAIATEMNSESEKYIITARATGKFDIEISGKTIKKASTSFSLERGEEVTITASYSPADANMEFGLLDSDGLFHPVQASDGSFKQTIKVDQRGSYTFAVRNNSSYKVSVSGFVNY